MRDALGQRGEAIFIVLMTEFHSNSGPIFKPQFLGDKWQYVDFIVELVGNTTSIPYFFVQVKTTREGYTKKLTRLKVKVSKGVCGLACYPAPTYIIGIDEIQEMGYIVSANGESLTSMSSLSTMFPINKLNRDILWKEVSSFWNRYNTNKLVSQFSDSDWR
ncbi:MAG: DUF4365 domain-containing protein [Scytonema sp. PMC 1069.18]|nr:DUF4365 domain-containing protein [Scytonema sp. PMC 1069.18]MEC4884299.1 DUF4365 domain-containing protein [Scytonema sp. PMC 1070.18]